MDSITLITFSFACWLALYLIARNNHPRTRLTGAGLLAYALVLGLQFTLSGEIWERVNWALLGNSIFCFLSGLDFALFSLPVAEFLGLPSPAVILVLGLGLIAYALALFKQTRTQPLSPPFARFAIVADLLWVLGSAALIFTSVFVFTTAGKWVIAIIADILLVFALAPIRWPAPHYQFTAQMKGCN